MRYPQLKVKQSIRQMVDEFKGYNHNLRIGDGEFYEMKNMTSDHYPVLAPRGKRGDYPVFVPPNNANGLIAKNGSLCYVDGHDFVMNGLAYDLGLSTDDRKKQLIPMGAYVIIMPDKKYINTSDTSDFGDIEASFYSGENQVSITPCTITGENMGEALLSVTAPTDPKDKDLWVDTSGDTRVLKRYSAASATWVSVPNTYVRINCNGIGKQFKPYDGVTVSGLEGAEPSKLNGSAVVWGCADNYLVLTGLIPYALPTVVMEEFHVVRNMPEMDYIIESDNRLWGCRYGVNSNGDTVNEIYASKLGDFKNWNCFMGLSTDSYAASCGTDGPFTGAITHLGFPLFFKENFIHKVYGNYPANFQIQVTACRGVQIGSDRSLAIVNETLFYKSRGAVCAYDGSLPVEVSYALGNETYSEAVGGAHRNKYYISMKDSAEKWHLFVYSVQTGMWHREDDFRADCFCSFMDNLYAIEHGSKNIIALLGSKTREEEKVSWMVQTGPIGTDMPDMKYISRLVVRLSLDQGTRVRMLIQYDSMGGWEHICTLLGRHLRSFSIPVRPRRCDHMRLRIEGEGDARIYSITKTIEQGSDIS